MKRDREDEERALGHLEIIKGLSESVAEAFEESRRRSLLALLDEGGADLSLLLQPQTSALLLGDTPHSVSCALLAECGAGGGRAAPAVAANPLVVKVVRLAADNGRLAIFQSSSGGDSSAADDTGFITRAQRGDVLPGDVVLYRAPADAAALARADDEFDGMDGAGVSADAQDAPPSVLSLLYVSGRVFTDAEAWEEAVRANIDAAMQWVHGFLELPAGPTQCMYVWKSSRGSAESGIANSGWRRVLGIAGLLDTRKELSGTLNPATQQELKKVIEFFLGVVVLFFSTLPSVFPLPSMMAALWADFSHSPLFLDGLGRVLPELVLQESQQQQQQREAHDVQRRPAAHLSLQTLQEALRLAADMARGEQQEQHQRQWQHLQPGHDGVTASAAGALHYVLFHLADTWMPRVPQTPAERSAAGAALADLVYRANLDAAVQWLNEVSRERKGRAAAGPGGEASGDEALLAELQVPPTHDVVMARQRLGATTVSEQLAAMTHTYATAISKDAVRFTRDAAVAAYAELYGEGARAARCVINALSDLSASEPADAIIYSCTAAADDHVGGSVTAAGLVCAVRASAVSQPPLRAGGLPAYSLSEMRHMAEFGMPLELAVSADVDPAHADAQRSNLRELQKRCQRRNGSVFVYVMVRLYATMSLFPALVTAVTTTATTEDAAALSPAAAGVVTAHVLANADMLPQMAAASATLTDSPDLWIVCGFHDARAALSAATDARAPLAPPPMLFPPHTPGLTYMDVIRRMSQQCRSLRTVARRPGRLLSGGSFSGSSAAEHGLWMDFFADGHVRERSGPAALQQSTVDIATGRGASARDVARRVLEVLPALTPAQAEALQSLTPVPNPRLSYSLQAVRGIAGGGKSTTLTALSLTRGELNELARRDHQVHSNRAIREARDAVRETMAAGPTSGSGGCAHPLPDDYLETLLLRFSGQCRVFAKLGEGLTQCAPPLLLNTSDEPLRDILDMVQFAVDEYEEAAAAEKRVENEEADANGSAGACGISSRLASLHVVLEQSRERSLGAPLALAVTQRLQRLQHHAAVVSAMSELHTAAEAAAQNQDPASPAAAAAPPLWDALLPVLFASKEMRDTVAAAKAAGAESWASYLRSTLWPHEGSVHDARELPLPSTAEDQAADSSVSSSHRWCDVQPADDASDTPLCVQLATASHLPRMSRDQASAMLGIYAGKQTLLYQHLLRHGHAGVREVFRIFHDLLLSVGAASQLARSPAVTASPDEALRHMLLPFLWRWRPAQLLVDDLDRIPEGFFTVLPLCSNVVFTTTPELPPLQKARTALPLALLPALERELHSAGAVTVTQLNDALRCPDETVQLMLSQLTLVPTSTRDAGPSGFPFDATLKVPSAASASRRPRRRVVPAYARVPSGGAVAAGGRRPGGPPLPGFVSFSPVECWTHAVGLDRLAAADAAAVEYVMDYWRRYGVHPASVCVYGRMAPDHTQVEHEGGLETYTCRPLPFDLEGSRGARECDYAIVCLSSLVHTALAASGRVGAAIAASAGVSVPAAVARQKADERYNMWVALQERERHRFTRMLQQTLWSVLARVRYGAVLIGSKELVMRVELLGRTESFVSRVRAAAAPSVEQSYWLPQECDSCVLATRCPNHFLCKRTATLTVGENEETEAESGVEGAIVLVRLRGTEACGYLCLRAFDGCASSFHACLSVCHAAGPAASDVGEEAPDPHARCPFPCGKTLACGHLCTRTCGEPCGECTFRGLRQLPCGQRVANGQTAEGAIRYTVFPHFQTLACGETPAPCVTPVKLPCPRCGVSSLVPCHLVFPDGVCSAEVAPTFALPERECPGCVDLYNKVAAKVPGTERLEALPGPCSPAYDDSDAAAMERHRQPLAESLPPELRAELARTMSVENKKAEVRLKLQVMRANSNAGGAADGESDTVVYSAAYEEQRRQQQEQAAQHRGLYETSMHEWKQKVMALFDSQTSLRAEEEARMPKLKSDANDEAERQREFFA